MLTADKGIGNRWVCGWGRVRWMKGGKVGVTAGQAGMAGPEVTGE